MKKTRSSFLLAFALVAMASLVFAPPADAACEICRYVEPEYVKVCQKTADASGWRTGRTDCEEGGRCVIPGECCYKSSSQSAACSIEYPGGCPEGVNCRIREPENQDF